MSEPKYYMHLHLRGQAGCRFVNIEDEELKKAMSGTREPFDFTTVRDMEAATELTGAQYQLLYLYMGTVPVLSQFAMIPVEQPDTVPDSIRQLLKIGTPQ